MDIDLFVSPYGECGLLCNETFDSPPAGVIFDAETLELTKEFLETSPFHLNITVEEELRDKILLAQKFYIGFLQDGLISDTIEVPLLYLNDPYGSDFNAHKKLSKPARSMVAFEQFMKRCTSAQPIHREDLGDETSNGSVLKGMDPKHLEFVPQLIRQRMLEAAPRGPSGPGGLEAMPQMPTPHPSGPGLGGGSGTSRRHIPSRRPIQRNEDED